MRDILFRGKTEKDKWIDGDLYQSRLKSIFMISRYTEYGNRMAEVVNPETVGQYTGLTDKNGKKIFEGDILAFSDRLVYVHWHDYCGCWDCSYIKAIDDKPTLHEERSPNKWRYNAEVIGNIHDNKELLEVK